VGGRCRLVKIQCHWELQTSVFAHFGGYICGNHLLSIMTPSPALCHDVTYKQNNWLHFLLRNSSRVGWNKSSARVSMMLYFLLVAATAALKLWAAGTKIRVADELCKCKAVLWVKDTDFICIHQGRKLCLCSH